MAAVAGFAVDDHDHVADLAGRAARAAEDAPVDDDAAAHAGSKGDEYAAAHAARGAKGAFGQRRGVGVVVDENGQAQAVPQARHQGHVHPAEVVAEGDQAAVGILLAGDAHAHGGEFLHRAPAFADDAAAEIHHIGGDVLKGAIDAGRATRLAQYIAAFVHHAGLGGGAAHVDADVQHGHSSLSSCWARMARSIWRCASSCAAL